MIDPMKEYRSAETQLLSSLALMHSLFSTRSGLLGSLFHPLFKRALILGHSSPSVCVCEYNRFLPTHASACVYLSQNPVQLQRNIQVITGNIIIGQEELLLIHFSYYQTAR